MPDLRVDYLAIKCLFFRPTCDAVRLLLPRQIIHRNLTAAVLVAPTPVLAVAFPAFQMRGVTRHQGPTCIHRRSPRSLPTTSTQNQTPAL